MNDRIQIISPAPKRRKTSFLLVGLPNGGKTKTGLGAAHALANGEPFIGIDMETHDRVNPSSSLYADKFPMYQGVIHLPNPTHPADFLDAMKRAYEFGGPVLFVDGLASLSAGANAWATQIKQTTNVDLHSAHRTVKDVLKEGLSMLLNYPGHVVATCLMGPKTHRREETVDGKKKTVIWTEIEVSFTNPRIEERFALTAKMTAIQRPGGDPDLPQFDRRLTTFRTKIDAFQSLDYKNPGQGFGRLLWEWANMETYPDHKGAVSTEKPEKKKSSKHIDIPEEAPVQKGNPYTPDSLWDYHDWTPYYDDFGAFFEELELAIKSGYIQISDDDLEASNGLMEYIKETTPDIAK